MLVLSRKPGEAIVVEGTGGPVRITVERCGPKACRLGLAADRSVRITREELLRREGGPAAEQANGYRGPNAAAVALVVGELALANERNRRASAELTKSGHLGADPKRADSYHAGYATALKNVLAKLGEGKADG